MNHEDVRNFFIKNRCKDQDLFDANELSAMFALGRRTFQRYKTDGTFPPPTVVIGKVQRWDCGTVADWYADTIERNRKENGNG